MALVKWAVGTILITAVSMFVIRRIPFLNTLVNG